MNVFNVMEKAVEITFLHFWEKRIICSAKAIHNYTYLLLLFYSI